MKLTKKERKIKCSRLWRKNNPERYKEMNHRYRNSKEGKAKMKEWKNNNPGYYNDYCKNRKKTDEAFRISQNMGSAICHSLKGKKEWRKWQDIVGYTIDDLIKHLEDKFNDKMTWDNYGLYWEIDHIKPKSLFRCSDTNDEFKKCWALSNLQPLEKIENRQKSNSFNCYYKNNVKDKKRSS